MYEDPTEETGIIYMILLSKRRLSLSITRAPEYHGYLELLIFYVYNIVNSIYDLIFYLYNGMICIVIDKYSMFRF